MHTEPEQVSKWIAGGRSPISHCWSELIDKQNDPGGNGLKLKTSA